MRGALLWTAGLTGSLAAHAALAAVLALSVDPAPVEEQQPPETQLEMAAYEVQRDQATAADTTGDTAREAAASGALADEGAIPQSTASAEPLAAPNAEPLRTAPPATPATQVAGETLAAAATAGPATSALTPSAPALSAQPANAPPVAAQSAAAAGLATLPAPTTALASQTVSAATTASLALPAAKTAAQPTLAASTLAAATPPAATSLDPAAAATATVAASTLAAPTSQPVAPPAAIAPPAALPTSATAADTPNAPAAADLPPPADFATAALAWSGGDGDTLDPASLAAIEAFMQPGDLSAAAQETRDGIEGLLAMIPCARLQTEFIPATGALELRGHIPENGLRAPVLAALQQEVGTSLPVTDNLLILPRPQCGALSGIADVGLPQSTDQLTNPRVVGTDAHAREYRFAAGDPFVLEMVAPDYPAFVYVDYFDAAGNVLHLVPNEFVPLEPHTPDQSFPVAQALNITIGPPYGQEIAVAFAASRPLYDGLRPIQEPAEDYLQWLKERVAQARAEDPDFKGEWVYFFVTTRASR